MKNSEEEIEALKEKFKDKLGEIEINIIEDEVINAGYNNKIVTLTSGLIKDDDLFIEGLALIIAHEIGHHYAPDFSPKCATREVEADFFAVCNLASIWDDQNYAANIDKAIQQYIKILDKLVPETDLQIRKKVMESARDSVFEICPTHVE